MTLIIVDGVKYVIRSGQMDDDAAKQVEADAYDCNAMRVVKFCNKWVVGGNA